MSLVKSCLFGLSVADAIGVPVEFQSRLELSENPVFDIRGYGTYNQPPGTWSDDSSLTFLLADSLSNGYDLVDIARRLYSYKLNAAWTPFDQVFDIGITTSRALDQLAVILRNGDYESLQYLRYEATEMDNGNGALMRILPLYFMIKGKPLKEQFEYIWQVGSLTHGHIRSALACFFYLRLLDNLAKGRDIDSAYLLTIEEFVVFTTEQEIAKAELSHFNRILSGKLHELPENEIESSGYVMHSLEAALWCLLRETTYRATVLAAVNLGRDTDTTAAIVGGLAGAAYGLERIPGNWLDALAKRSDIEHLCERLEARYSLID